ncbi:alpha-galactosidase [Microbacterium indicum]|uniref:alpha-galactosidase n=1 Tax=Microbacterium indicum TaxID=358100 RepID=UPI000566B4FC|nr:alpha-galactosidase [Microbacterium indicum]
MTQTPAALSLRGGGSSVVVALGTDVPRILHWGADVGALSDADLAALAAADGVGVLGSEPNAPRTFPLWATQREAWSGTPTLDGHAAGSATTPRPRLASWERTGEGSAVFVLEDRITRLTLRVALAVDRFGVLSVDERLERGADAEGVYELGALTALLPVPERAGEILDFTGRWCRERSPQRSAFGFGTHLRRARRGKPGHDSPFLLAAGTAGFGFGRGEVWAAHLAWSGEQRYLAERLPEGSGSHAGVLGLGEGLAPGEIRLAPGDAYTAPTALFAWSDAGLDGVSARFHDRLRARDRHPRSPRPVTLNSWEAVYFDHDLPTLGRLVDRASEVGVERFVLDDGWFGSRRDDRTGLGDWTVSPDAWPDGLGPLVERVRAHGMQFGLWFEPEMISPDSDLARAHPDWILGPADGPTGTSRNQQVLDISRPDAFAHLLESISALVAEYRIDYIKWDHNRELLEAVARRDGADRPIVHEQTLALYALLDELRLRHPGLEIESCSAGGARIDLGILDRTDRVWASDCNDPVERGRIERWTGLLLPPELIGGHIGPGEAHTTGRATSLSARMASAFFGHAGIEWNLLECTDEELAEVARWVAEHKRLRPLLHGGRAVHADGLDAGAALDGVVAHDGSRAVYRWSRTETAPAARSGSVVLPGLPAAGSYTVRILDFAGGPRTMQDLEPAWVEGARSEAGLTVPAALLGTVGLPLPTLAPQHALIVEVSAR